MWSLTALSAILLASLATASPLDKRETIEECLTSSGVPYDTKNGNDWNQDVAPFNRRLPFTPAAIAVPKTTEHVRLAVACATKLGLKVSPKGGGHSYASYGLGGENGHLVVELDRMNKITVDQTTYIASVEAGSRLGHVLTELNKQGKRAISHGTCPGVGVAGHALHGGFGFSSHSKGLAVDWIVGATVVLANATVVNCSSTENPDLLWALKGAGSSYGIVTTFFFKTFAAPSQTTSFTANLNWNNVQNTVKGWTALQEYTANTMPAEMNMRVFGNAYSTQLQGLYHGNSSQLQAAIQPLMSSLGTSLSSRQTDWIGGFTAYSNGQTVDVSHPYNIQETFFSKSLTTTALNNTAMTSAVNYWLSTAKSTSRDWYIIIDMHGGKNSYISSVPKNESSYAHRDALFLYEFYDRVYSGSYPSNGFSFLNGWVNAFTSKLDASQWGMYINYADPTMSRKEAQDVYYRGNLGRLQSIKAAMDPEEVFYFPQAIEPVK
ncbi:FAD-binding domain-containing protein [Delitschia confertaspora ATCC 74209]|uniref:FAD-binding domain-containing protein n=1 Tax=Delitschia confertaspora ATCC 74209 TaxID=1513339 RepID=A0A9P4JUZ4_9PLEO|nr:FAD-binding domain-containing protein [Delitschia confertaspora ATCC 74209]